MIDDQSVASGFSLPKLMIVPPSSPTRYPSSPIVREISSVVSECMITASPEISYVPFSASSPVIASSHVSSSLKSRTPSNPISAGDRDIPSASIFTRYQLPATSSFVKSAAIALDAIIPISKLVAAKILIIFFIHLHLLSFLTFHFDVSFCLYRFVFRKSSYTIPKYGDITFHIPSKFQTHQESKFPADDTSPFVSASLARSEKLPMVRASS